MPTARLWWNRHEEVGNLNELPRRSRPNVLNAEQENEIIERIEENPFLTAAGFAREYGVSRPVIASLFRRHGLTCRTAARETRLKEEHRINRIAFCQVLLEQWDEDRLNSTVFCDEKNFCTDVSWRSKVYRPYNSRYDPHYVQEETKSGSITNNYWDAIGYEGPVTPIVQIDGRFESNQYMRIIRRHIIPLMNRFNDEGAPRIFMQDNSPVHTSARVMALFSRQNFHLMDWPPFSPDLNPIENVWSHMIYDWPTIHPRNQQNLDIVVQERWNALEGKHRKFFNKKTSHTKQLKSY